MKFFQFCWKLVSDSNLFIGFKKIIIEVNEVLIVKLIKFLYL